MVTLFMGSRDWGIVVFAILDFVSNFVVPMSQKDTHCLYFISIIQKSFLYIVPCLLVIHCFWDGFRWQLYPLYFQLFLTSVATRLNLYLKPYKSERVENVNLPETVANITLHSMQPRPFSTFSSPFPMLVLSLNFWRHFFYYGSSVESVPYPVFCSFSSFHSLVVRIRWVKIILVVLSLLFCFLFPVPRLPAPTGSWGCGVEEIQFLADYNYFPGFPFDRKNWRTENLHHITNCKSANKKLPLKRFHCLIFYPIEHHRYKNDTCYPWLPSKVESIKVISSLLGIPLFFLRCLLRLETHSIMLAPLSKRRKKYPIVFLSHEIGLTKTSQSMLCEALASHGSIVVSVEHADGTAISTVTKYEENLTTFTRSDLLGSVCGFQSPLLSRLKTNLFYPFYPSSKNKNRFVSTHFHSKESSNVASANEASEEIANDLSAFSDLLVTLDNKQGSTSQFLVSSKGGSSSFPSQETSFSPFSSEMESRHTQLIARVAELRSAHHSMIRLSETSGSWIKDRIDWNASSIIGFGFGGASALLTCICSSIETAHYQSQKKCTLYQNNIVTSSRATFQNCVLICPWLDAMKDIELRFYEAGIHYKSKENILPYLKLSQNFLLINTTEETGSKSHNKIRLLKLMTESTGQKVLVQFTRCVNLDFTDIPLLSPYIFRFLGLSGPRSCFQSMQMLNRTILNFLNYHYRRSLFGLDLHEKEQMQQTKQLCAYPFMNYVKHHFECKNHAMKNDKQRYETNTVTCVCQKNHSKACFKYTKGKPHSALKETHWNVSQPLVCYSSNAMSRNSSSFPLCKRVDMNKNISSISCILHVLKLAGVPDHYIRNLSGLRTPPNLKQCWRKPNSFHTLSSCNHSLCDVLDGISEYMDQEDTKRRRQRIQRNVFCYYTVADVCHI